MRRRARGSRRAVLCVEGARGRRRSHSGAARNSNPPASPRCAWLAMRTTGHAHALLQVDNSGPHSYGSAALIHRGVQRLFPNATVLSSDAFDDFMREVRKRSRRWTGGALMRRPLSRVAMRGRDNDRPCVCNARRYGLIARRCLSSQRRSVTHGSWAHHRTPRRSRCIERPPGRTRGAYSAARAPKRPEVRRRCVASNGS